MDPEGVIGFCDRVRPRLVGTLSLLCGDGEANRGGAAVLRRPASRRGGGPDGVCAWDGEVTH